MTEPTRRGGRAQVSSSRDLARGLFAALVACGCAPAPAPRPPAPPAAQPAEDDATTCVRDPVPADLAPEVRRVLALRVASWDGDERRARRCLEEGADPNLAWPGAARWPRLTRLVLDAGASPHGPDGEPCPACAAAGVAVDSCPLCDAARHGAGEVVSLLVASGAEPDAPEGPTGARPLHLAAQRHALDVVRALLEAGADVNARDEDGQTPLMYAVSVLSEELLPVTRLLVDAGADPQLEDDAGRRALDHAAETLGDHVAALEPLLSPP